MRKKTDLKIWSFYVEPKYNYHPITDGQKPSFQELETNLTQVGQKLSQFFPKNQSLFLRLFSNLLPSQERSIPYKKLIFVSNRNRLFVDQMYLTFYLNELIEVSYYFDTPRVLTIPPTFKPFCAEGSLDDLNLLTRVITREIS